MGVKAKETSESRGVNTSKETRVRSLRWYGQFSYITGLPPYLIHKTIPDLQSAYVNCSNLPPTLKEKPTVENGR